MKKLGLIGGTGPESTIEYYRRLTHGVQRRAGSFPPLSIESLSVFDVLRFCEAKDYGALADYLVGGFCRLADAGAQFACLTGITPHIVFDEVSSRSPIPLVSMVETVCAEAVRRQSRRILLLGTCPTMRGSFFQKPFLARGIEVLTPNEEEMCYIGGKIEHELELGRIVPETQRQLCAIVERIHARQFLDAVVLGCTELPLILRDELLPVPCLDAMQLHIDCLIEQIAEG